MKKIKIFVTLKNGVLDPQGKTIHHSLETLGFDEIDDVRVGKYIELTFPDNSKCNNEESINKMCEKLLHNPVIEDYRIEY